jgi:diguanylate cyclase (GGDEF)-like protein
MNGAVFALAVNAGMALLFAASFAVIALSYRAQRNALGFCAAYVIGALTPISELLVRFSGMTSLFMVTSYASFFGSLLVMAAALEAFRGRPRSWGVIAALFLIGMVLRAIIWGGARNTIGYELVYQLPFAIAAVLTAVTAVRVGRSRSLYVVLSASYGLIALHFVTKPFFAVAFGSGRTAQEYSTSTYALFSQACTGVLMVGTGLLLLLIVVQKAVAQSQLDAETDPLSDIANRRGFDRQAQEAFARAVRLGRPLSAVMFDLDHFKAINDTHGHAIGDQVIAAFAGLLRRAAPQSAIVARIGGEEFAMLLERTTAEGACLSAQAIRVAIADLANGGLPGVTVSGGVAERREGDSLADLMRRADRASYQAKEEGRDRICVARDPAEAAPGTNIVSLNLRRA